MYSDGDGKAQSSKVQKKNMLKICLDLIRSTGVNSCKNVFWDCHTQLR